MANVLFQENKNLQPKSNSFHNLIQQAQALGPSDAVFNKLYSSFPRFKEFADGMQGKSADDMCASVGTTYDFVKQFKW